MPAITIHNLSDATHRALKARAADHGRITEAEIRAILENAVASPERIKLGSILATIGLEFGGVDLNIQRDAAPARTVTFE